MDLPNPHPTTHQIRLDEMHAYVLLRVGKGAAGGVADAVALVDGVFRAECVLHGEYDVVLDVRVADVHDLERLIAQIGHMPEIENAETCISAVHQGEALIGSTGGSPGAWGEA